jgi:hypothetical protein
MIESDDPDAFYTKDLRARLATTFMFHAQDPTLMDQGINNGTCWIQQGHVWAMVQHPDAMADLLKQIALKGKYTTKNSGEHDPTPKTYEFLKSYLSFPHGSEEAGWTIEKADAVMNSIGQKNVYRSPVGKIFDNVLPILGNRKEVDGGCYATRKTPEGLLLGSRGIIYSITGDILCDTEKNMYGWHEDANLIQDDLRLTLLEKGALNTYREGHGTSMHLRRLNGEWVIYHDDQHGEHTDWVISKISDIERWAKGDTSVEQPVRRRKR